ncbi:hypothetical protein [Microcella sp.]|uniref:hypothetical protein n=1 Tax=Microcella sp. TaxID=1913979 RepID=UPI00391B4179
MARLMTAAALAALAALGVAGCAPADSGCSGAFDAELTPDASGYATPIEAAEAWAATTDAPDTGWTESGETVVADDWVLTVVEAGGGGWLVQSQRCA